MVGFWYVNEQTYKIFLKVNLVKLTDKIQRKLYPLEI